MVAASGFTESANANGDTRTIYLYQPHTQETIAATYLVNGQYDSAVLEKLNWFLRDWRRNEPTKMDPRLFDVMWEVYRESGSSQPIEVVSAYRSPETNAMLRRRSGGVADHSQHILGKAIDQHYVDVPMSRIRQIAMKLERGGVGYYPTAGIPFVHMDVGGVRHWPRMSYDQLARLFPDGKTVHIPSNGQPLQRYEEARAELEARGDSFSYPTSTEVKSKGFFAWLFGGGDDEEDTGAAAGGGSRRGQTRVASSDRSVPVGASPPMLYGSQDKDGGVREFNLASSMPSAPFGAPAFASTPAPQGRRAASAPAPIQQAALDPTASRTSETHAVKVPGRAMNDSRQSTPIIAFRMPGTGLTPSLRPVELAASGPKTPLPLNRPPKLAALTPKFDRAPGVNAPRKDPINDLIAAMPPVRTTHLPSDITQGLGGRKPAVPSQAMAYAPPGPPTPSARTYAMLPLARSLPLVAARLDRSNFRSLTGSGSAARAVAHYGLGSAVTALRPAAQASPGTMMGQLPPVARGFATDATDLTSDRFSGTK